MANVFLQQGDKAVLDSLVAGGTVFKNLKLFQNNHTPAVGDVNGDYTEATFTGYSAIDIHSTFGAAFINGSNQGEIDGSQQTFTRSAGATSNTIYGAYVTDNAGDVVFAEKFPAPISMATAGDAILYTPKITAVSA